MEKSTVNDHYHPLSIAILTRPEGMSIVFHWYPCVIHEITTNQGMSWFSRACLHFSSEAWSSETISLASYEGGWGYRIRLGDPPKNIQKTMENHHFIIFIGKTEYELPFSILQTVSLPEGKNGINGILTWDSEYSSDTKLYNPSVPNIHWLITG